MNLLPRIEEGRILENNEWSAEDESRMLSHIVVESERASRRKLRAQMRTARKAFKQAPCQPTSNQTYPSYAR